MRRTLPEALDILRAHAPDLRARGVAHAAVFGSVVRGQNTADSDVDVLVELDESRDLDLVDYANIALLIGTLFDERADVVNRKTLKPLLRDRILNEAVNAF